MTVTIFCVVVKWGCITRCLWRKVILCHRPHLCEAPQRSLQSPLRCFVLRLSWHQWSWSSGVRCCAYCCCGRGSFFFSYVCERMQHHEEYLQMCTGLQNRWWQQATSGQQWWLFRELYSWTLIERTIAPQVHIAMTSINRPVKQTHWTNAVGKASYPHCRWWMYAHDVYVYVCACKDLHSALRSHRKLPHRYIAHGAMRRHCLYNHVAGAMSRYATRFRRPFLDPARLAVRLLHCGVSTCAVVWFGLHFLYGIVWL